MDPEGLSILICVILALGALLALYSAGGILAADGEREKVSRLGFSDRAAGAVILFCVLFGAFLWQLCDVLAPHGWLVWAIPCLAVYVLAGVTVFSFGFAGGKAGPMRVLAVLGKVLTAPAKLCFQLTGTTADSGVTEEELMNMVEDVEEQSIIDENQKKMIASIVEFDDVTAADVMTHRTEIVSVADTANIGNVVRLAMAEGISRIPVYHKTLDDVVGMLHVKDLFGLWDDPARSTELASAHMRKAMFVPEACRARELLLEFRRKHTQIAVVVDEYGGTSGLVTMEDVLEEIVGNIQDEYDNEEEDLVADGDGFIATGAADLEDLFEAFDLELPEPDEDDPDDIDTVGGLVIDRLGRIPDENEHAQVHYGGVVFTVLKASERRIEKVRCTREESSRDSAGA